MQGSREIACRAVERVWRPRRPRSAAWVAPAGFWRRANSGQVLPGLAKLSLRRANGDSR